MSIALFCVALCVQAPAFDALALRRAKQKFSFTENLGQWDTPARFVGELGDTLLRVEPGAIWVHRGRESEGGSRLLRLSFEGCSKEMTFEGLRPTPTLHSYFVGNDSSKWIHAASSYEQVRLIGVYPGIDLVLGERKGALKYDIHVAPGADLSQFVLRCEGADAICMEADGILRIDAGNIPLLHSLGDAWEELGDGTKRSVHPSWNLLDQGRFGIALEGRDEATGLIIDPELVWATYLGSSTTLTPEGASAVDVAGDGTVVVAGTAGDLSFPTTPGSVVIAPPGEDNIFVTKLTSDGSALVYSCIIGGSIGPNAGGEYPYGVKLDGLGRAYVAGRTTSLTFPTTPGAFGQQPDFYGDGFALRLSPNGDALEYSTLIGAPGNGEDIYACAVAPSGALVVVGQTGATNFPTTPNAFQSVMKGVVDIFVSRLSPDGSSLEWSTYLGGNSLDQGVSVVLAENEDVLLTGWTASTNFPTTPGSFESVWQGSTFDFKAFVTRMHPSGSSLAWSTLLGGPTYDGGEGTKGLGIAVIPSGDVFVVGRVTEFSFPTTPGAFQTVFHYNPLVSGTTLYGDGFLTRFNANGSALVYSTLLGTDYYETAIGVAVDASGIATVTSQCGLLPTTPGSYQSPFLGQDNFGVTSFHPSGSRLIYSGIIGGPYHDVVLGMAATPEGRVTTVGYTSGGFPTTAGSFDPTFNGGQYDGVVATLALHPTGVSALGTSTPACHGPLNLQASEMPQSGSTSFALLCSNAPSFARGVLLIGRTALTQPVHIGASTLWVDPGSAWTHIVPVASDLDGFVEVALPLAGVPTGAPFVAQALFRHRPQCIAQGLTCASQALEIVIQ